MQVLTIRNLTLSAIHGKVWWHYTCLGYDRLLPSMVIHDVLVAIVAILELGLDCKVNCKAIQLKLQVHPNFYRCLTIILRHL